MIFLNMIKCMCSTNDQCIDLHIMSSEFSKFDMVKVAHAEILRHFFYVLFFFGFIAKTRISYKKIHWH